MISQTEIEREASEHNISELQAYRRLAIKKELARSLEVRQQGYRHLLK
jgi:hypothetical protein